MGEPCSGCVCRGVCLAILITGNDESNLAAWLRILDVFYLLAFLQRVSECLSPPSFLFISFPFLFLFLSPTATRTYEYQCVEAMVGTHSPGRGFVGDWDSRTTY